MTIDEEAPAASGPDDADTMMSAPGELSAPLN
jgi:hypothetical protein